MFSGLALVACTVPPAKAPATAAPAAAASGVIATYTVPPGKPTARLLMRANLQPDEQYGVFVADDALTCKGMRRVGGGTPQQQPAPAALAAGSLMTLAYVVTKAPRQMCQVLWSFTPEAGRVYALQGVASPAGCLSLLFDVTQPDRSHPAAGAVRRNVGGQLCAPLDKSAPVPRSPLEGGQSNGDAVLNPAATAADLEGLIKP